MAAWSKPGSGREETTSSAQRNPCASEIATRTGAGRTAEARIRSSCSSTVLTFLSALQAGGQPGTQVGTEVRVVEREVDERADVPGGVTEVVPVTTVHDHVHRVALVDQQRDGVGELQLTACARLDPVDRVEDGPVEQVAPGRGERGRGLLRRGLLDHAAHPFDVRVAGV